MRKEYVIYEFPLDFFNALDNFMSNFSFYTLIDNQADRRVYKSIVDGICLDFFSFGDKICLICSTDYNSNKSPFEQENIVIYGSSKSMNHNIDERNPWWQKTQGYYIPAATLTQGQKLVANNNGDTFMFSMIEYHDLDYETHYATMDRTKSIFFGYVTKYLDFDGGFFYGGDFVCTYEFYWTYFINGSNKTFIRKNVACLFDSEFVDGLNHHVKLPPRDYRGFWSYPWVDDPYADELLETASQSTFPDSNHNNRFEVMLFARIDDAPNRRKNEKIIEEPMGDEIPVLYRNNLWAVTMKNDYYVPLVCSIDFERYNKSGTVKEEIKLPTYEPLISHTSVDVGHTVNILNNISSIMHLYFMVMRDPNVLNNYSTIGYNDVLNFVNMYNMSTNRIINGSYPVREKLYNCFQMGCRRSMFGMKGYSGIAFLIDGVYIPQEEPPLPPTPPTPPEPPVEPPEPDPPTEPPPDEPTEPPVEPPPEEPEEPSDPDEPPDNPPNLGLLDIPRMKRLRSGGEEVLNTYYEDDDMWAYGGDTDFSLPSGYGTTEFITTRGVLIMQQSYRHFSSVTFTFCDDRGDNRYTVTWTRDELDAAFASTKSYFDLIKTKGNFIGDFWQIVPFTNTFIYGESGPPDDLIWVCYSQGCVLVECIGNP